MASIIEGYNYDIFISYRQKDNKGDRWVSEFVDALKDELESTFKDDISIYFDENPHDRLQDTHNVDKSLEGKLKCLIFIPIISQTYCDPRSYAWQYEFLAFNRLAEKDQYGKDVKLKSGNVASRVLPIRIHDLDEEDTKLFEKETGSVLRALDFVFKTSSGVNRPLTPSDNPDKNLNKTFYRDQINKVANAIKEIIGGLKTEPVAPVKEKTQQKELLEEATVEEIKLEQAKPLRKLSKRKLLSGLAIIAILIIVAVFVYPKIFKQDRLEYLRSKGEISVAVMPFKNTTDDVNWDNIQLILKNNLSGSMDLEVRETNLISQMMQNQGLTSNESITTPIAIKLSKKLNADVFITGSVFHSGNNVRLQAEIHNSNTGSIIKPFNKDTIAKEVNPIEMVNSLSREIENFLIISILQKEIPLYRRIYVFTNNQKALNDYLIASDAFINEDFAKAIQYYTTALNQDSNFYFLYARISLAYFNMGAENTKMDMLDSANKWADKAYQKIKLMDPYLQNYTSNVYWGNRNPEEAIKYRRAMIELDKQDPTNYYMIGLYYNRLSRYEESIPYFERANEILKRIGLSPYWVYYYTFLGKAYHETGHYKKERKLYMKAEKDFHDNQLLIGRQAILSLSGGKTKAAMEYIEKYKSIRKDNSVSEAAIASNLAGIYSEAGILDKAEEFFTDALNLEPNNPDRMNNLAWFLIDTDRNITNGLELIEKALEINPNHYQYVDTKSWGLYKQGKLEEARKLIHRSDSLKPIYNHRIFLHKQEIEKALASQKNNN